RIIKNFKERGWTAVTKSSGCPRVSNKLQDHLLLRSQLQNHVSSSAELAQECQQVGVKASAHTVKPRLLDNGLVSGRAAKKPLLSKKNVKDRLKFCRKYKDWTAEDWCKVISSDEAPLQLFETSGKSIVRRRKGERYHESCDVPTVKHPETIHVWRYFSTILHCRHSFFYPSGAPPWDLRPGSGAGVVHYHLLPWPRSVSMALGPASLFTA
uniref:Transposase Tc1-like domain-containing protein n=1 Tax=Cyprinus carpio carpio TaxID=630221 RepID=A0A9J7YM25_CYPCA